MAAHRDTAYRGVLATRARGLHRVAMPRYANLSGQSGAVAYESAPDRIVVQFVDGSVYLYDSDTPGAAAVAEMQRLAASGRGLSTYISQHVQRRYARKLR